MVYSHMQAKYSYTFKIFKLLRKQSEEMSGRMMDTQCSDRRSEYVRAEKKKKKTKRGPEKSPEEEKGREVGWHRERRANGWTDRNNKEGQEAGHSCAYL